MIKDTFKKVKSPFTDDLIKSLIERYISIGCDDNVFYNEINNLKNENEDNAWTNELIKKIYLKGKPQHEAWQDKDNTYIYYEMNEYWTILTSGDDPFDDMKRTPDNKRKLMYRFYLNIKGKDKADFILKYLSRCKNEKIPYEFKFSNDDSRSDQIVILSDLENFEYNLKFIEECIIGKKLGKVPMLIGEYNNGIGIAEEYYNRLNSPTKIKLTLIKSAIKKYLCDHKDEVSEQLSDDEKKEIDEIIKFFEYKNARENSRKEIEGDKYYDRRKRYFQKKDTMDCIKEYIETEEDSRIYSNISLNLRNAIQKVYEQNPEKFLNEVTNNYRMIGTQVWGFSKNFAFSSETEDKYLSDKEYGEIE